MTIGERDALSQETKTSFVQSGIAHILAVSGLHVGIVAFILHFILGFFPISKKLRILIVVMLTFCYAGICGFRPPVARAFIMMSLVMGVLVFERPKNMENSIFIALLTILAFNPVSLYGASLQLSFAAVWGIITFYPPVMERIMKRFRLNKPAGYFIRIFLVSVIVNIIITPLVAAHFGSFPLYGILVNLLAVPLAFLIICSGIASIALISLGTVVSPLAALFSFFTGIFLQVLSTIAEYVSGIPYASISGVDVSPLSVLCFMVWLYIISRSQGRNAFKKAIIYIPLTLLLVSAWHPMLFAGHFGGREDSVVFFDVGQGDAALVKYGNSRHFLVDTGPRYGKYDAGKSIIAPSLRNAGIKHLDGIFLSHTDTDHTEGIMSILKDIRTDHIFCRRSIADSLGELFGSTVIGVSAGDSIAFEEGGILILSPTLDERNINDKKQVSENDYSLLVRFDINGVRLLFPGDMEKDVQRRMVLWGTALESEILKVPHHGAPGLYGKFIETVKPELAVISCGVNNRYGHPAETTISTLLQHNCRILRTDSYGTIRVLLPSIRVEVF